MQLACFSDTHGNLIALQAAMEDYRTVCPDGADVIWMLGDVAAMGARPAECVRVFMEMANEAKAASDTAKAVVEAGGNPTARPKPQFRLVRGNTDRYLTTGAREGEEKPAENAEALKKMLESSRRQDEALRWGVEHLSFAEYEFLARAQGECDLYVPGFGTVIGYHGTPGNDEGRLEPDTPDEEAADALLDREGRLGIGAHIHKQMDRQLPRGWRAVNIGSIGYSYDKPGFAEWGLFTFADGTVTVDLRAVPFDVEAAIADLHTVGFPVADKMIKRLREGEKGAED